MQILDDLHSETRRLFIAGSKFAKNDPRILKYIPILEKMGEKAPIMKKLAEKYIQLTKEGQPEALVDAGTFLYAVMATQGTTELSGNATETVAFIDELPKTIAPHSRLKPIIDALTLSMQGRYDVVEKAFKQGLLKDFRLYAHIVRVLDDKYSELSNYIYRIIPSIGAVLIPYLLEQYNVQGRQGDAMRLSLLSELAYENAEQLAFKALEEGSTPVAVAATSILGKNPKNEKYLLTLANDKKADIREAAFVCLINMDSASGKELMIKLIQGSKYKSAIPAARLCNDSGYSSKLLEIVKTHYEKLFEKELTNDGFQKANNKFTELLTSLDTKPEEEIYKFYIQLLTDERYNKRFDEYKIHHYLLSDMYRIVCRQLRSIPAEKAIMICEEAMSLKVAKKSYDVIEYYYDIAKKTYTEERMFSTFSKYYEAGIISFLTMFCERGIHIDEAKDKESKDKEFEKIRATVSTRWKKLFIEKNDIYAIRVLISPVDEYEKEMQEVIIKSLKEAAHKKRGNLQLGLTLGRLVETTYSKAVLEKAAEACYKVFERSDGYDTGYFYQGIGQENILKLFGSDYREKFEQLSKKKANSVFKTIMEILAVLPSDNQEK